MAEARLGIRPTPAFGAHERQVDPTTQNIQMVYGSTGLHIYIPRPRILFRKFLRAIWRRRNKIQEACYPLPAWSIFVANSAALVLVGRETNPVGAWIQRASTNGPLKWLWKAPLSAYLPEAYRRAMFAINTTSVALFLFTTGQRAVVRHLLSYTGWVHEVRSKNPSWPTKIWAFLIRYIYIRSKSPLMLTYQNCLPKLPLPSLERTLERYLTTIQPLVDGAEVTRQRSLIQSFLSNEGKILQRFLRVKHFFSTNYVSNWWLEIVYLRYRKSLSLNSNYYGIGGAFGVPTRNQVSRAAVLILNLVRSKLDIDHERLPPHLLNGFIPLCMDQYLHAFGVTRTPHAVQDHLAHYGSTSRHIVVFHKGRMFTVACFSTHTGRLLTAKQIETTLLGIVQDTTPSGVIESAIPVLTNLPRAQWASIREMHFRQDPANNAALERIESALFAVSLEESIPANFTEEGLIYYLGNEGKNRWADKSFHLILTGDGRCGIAAEHSWGDAPVIAHLLELAVAREVTENPYEADGTVRRVQRDVQKMDKSQFAAERLHFNITDGLAKVVEEAIPVIRQDLQTLDLHIGCYERYGKGAVKKFRCGADAWIQMAFQLAYFRDQGHFDQTYESGMTRLFRFGRTETIRSVSKESCAFARAMDDASVDRAKKAKLLHVACEAHQSYSHNAMVGNGVDRHLLALYIVSVGMGMKSDFLADFISRPWKLSTSQIPQRQTPKGTWPNNDMGDRYVGASGGFGPVAEDGYGISYTIAGEYRFFFHVSSRKEAANTNSKRMYEQVAKALDDMGALFPEVDLSDVAMPADIAKLSYHDSWKL